MIVCVVLLSQMLYMFVKCCVSCVSRYLRCYMLNDCVCCLVISDVICCLASLPEMIHDVCVVSLSQMLYVKCLCMLSRYLRCYMLNVCVCCFVISDVIC